MKLFVCEEAGQITNVWCDDVPEDFRHEDVLYTWQVAAESGNQLAAKALPFLARPGLRTRAGVRVYLDNA